MLRSPAVSIEFDDGYRSAHRNALPLLEERGWRATQYVISGLPAPEAEADPGELMSYDEVRDWAARADLGCHTMTHRRLAELGDRELEAELARSRADLEELVGREVELFAAPFGETTDGATAVARRVFRSQRVVGGPVNVANGFDPFGVRGLLIKPTTSDEEFADHLRRAKRRRGWVVLVWHRVGQGLDSLWDVPSDQFRRQLDLIAASGLEVVDTTTMLDRFEALTRP